MAAVDEIPLGGSKHGSKGEDTQNYATEAIKSGLSNVKISKVDVKSLERKLQAELFEKWEENCEVMKARRISVENMKSFLDHMRGSYKGMTDEIRTKMDGILFTEGTWELKILEYKFNTGSDGDKYSDKDNNSRANYGLIAFGRSPDKLYYDCMYVNYSMHFKISNKKEHTGKNPSVVSALVSWTTTDTKLMEKKFGPNMIKDFQNFFRFKALEGFCKEGLIDKITYEEEDLGKVDDAGKYNDSEDDNDSDEYNDSDADNDSDTDNDPDEDNDSDGDINYEQLVELMSKDFSGFYE